MTPVLFHFVSVLSTPPTVTSSTWSDSPPSRLNQFDIPQNERGYEQGNMARENNRRNWEGQAGKKSRRGRNREDKNQYDVIGRKKDQYRGNNKRRRTKNIEPREFHANSDLKLRCSVPIWFLMAFVKYFFM